MKVGIIGLGVVGRAVFDGLQQIGHSLSFYDVAHSNSDIKHVIESDIIFVCVPTPSLPTGECDTSIVSKTVETLSDLNFKGVVAIKSTVTPGTTQHLINQFPSLMICFVPEFLREKSALTDFMDKHDILIVGTENEFIYKTVVSSHGNIPDSTIQISPTEAEVSKYFANVFNSLRIVFANGMFEICKALGADYQQVFRAITQRENINSDYLRCSDYLRGFSGHCLPKDSRALSTLVNKLNLDIKLFEAINDDNEKYTK